MKIIERECEVSKRLFRVDERDQRYLERLSPSFGGEKFLLPPPRLAPDERKRRRLAFRNERNLYHRKCDFSAKPIISVYSPDKPYTVYAKDVWWSDSWDFRKYGRDFDFSRPFFEQFAELKSVVPHVALITSPDADENNCPYINFAGNSKNCYMTFDSDFNEDSYHSNVLKHSKNCCDCSYAHTCELCYECIDCSNCYELRYSQDCTNCDSSAFLHGCIGCSECFMCCNLVQKKYHIENKPYSKEEYFSKLRSFDLRSRSAIDSLRARFREFHQAQPKKFCRLLKAENCIGDYILNAKNCYYCFNISECEDLRFCDSVYDAKDCMDVSSFGEGIECVYNSGTIGINCFNILMSFVAVLNCSNLIYCDNVRQSENCFACCSIKRGKYCVLNKQYSKEDYEKLCAKIVRHMQETGEWGEYFPMSLSLFGYNETMANEHFPITEQEAKSLGANWSAFEAPKPNVSVIDAKTVPDSLADSSESILEQAISCEQSGRPFRITLQELKLYRDIGIPLPNLHPDVRHRRRLNARNPQKLWRRKCAETGESIWSSYAPDSPSIVYGESAYQNALT